MFCICVYGARLDVVISFGKHESKKINTPTKRTLSQLCYCVYIVLLSNQNCFLFFCLAFTRLNAQHICPNQCLMSRRRCCYCFTLFGVYTQHTIHNQRYVYICVRVCVSVCTVYARVHDATDAMRCECVGLVGSIFISVVYSAVGTLTSCLCRVIQYTNDICYVLLYV